MDNRSIPVLFVGQALHRAKEVAEAANHATSQFLANMGHEIQSSLNARSASSRTPESPRPEPSTVYSADLKRLLATTAGEPREPERLTPRRLCQMAALLGQLKAAIQVGSAQSV